MIPFMQLNNTNKIFQLLKFNTQMGIEGSRGKQFSYYQKCLGIQYILICYVNDERISFHILPSNEQATNCTFKEFKKIQYKYTPIGVLFPTHEQFYQELEKAKNKSILKIKKNYLQFQIMVHNNKRKVQVLLSQNRKLSSIERCFLTEIKQLKNELKSQGSQAKISQLNKVIQKLSKKDFSQRQNHRSELSSFAKQLEQVKKKLSQQMVKNGLLMEQNKTLNKLKKRMSNLVSQTTSSSKITSNNKESDEDEQEYDEDQKEQQRMTKYPNLKSRKKNIK